MSNSDARKRAAEREQDADVAMSLSKGHGAEKDALVEQACEVMHDAYEAAAVTAGWETQTRSRKPWADVPEANKATMRVAVSALLLWLEARVASTVEKDPNQ